LILAESRPADPRQWLGRLGESAAGESLERAGLRILERRCRTRAGEIDLIAEDGEILVFVEVKTRAGTGYGTPAAAVTKAKQQRMARVALIYLSRRKWLARRCRFDVVEVFTRGRCVERVNHIRDAFRL
jgi:putative endonuclease